MIKLTTSIRQPQSGGSAVTFDTTFSRGSGHSEQALPPLDEIAEHHITDERQLIGTLVERAVFTSSERVRTTHIATAIVEKAREHSARAGGFDAFMQEYGLSSDEGVVLMSLAESLLRIPDAPTADQLIAEKLGEGNWDRHRGQSPHAWVNASTWGMIMTGRVVNRGGDRVKPASVVRSLTAKLSEPVIRQAVRTAVGLLGDQFILGTSIKDALARARLLEAKGLRFSYDMLGEGALTQAEADRYFDSYMNAIQAVGSATGPFKSVQYEALMARPSISIKLSALHPRFEPGKEERCAAELLPRLKALLRSAFEANVPVTFDAEEQERLEPTLRLFGACVLDPQLERWPGCGIAVQAYSRRAMPTLRWLRRLAEKSGKRIPVRLVKGAYWDSEIKRAQEAGLNDYPVFTRKVYTDVSYLACVRYLLADPGSFYAQFATHNAHTLASAQVAGADATFEYQRLQGMGDAVLSAACTEAGARIPCRIYAPVGERADLVAYLVRRLLENGANSSFVHRLCDQDVPVADLVADPVAFVERERARGREERVAWLPKPTHIFKDERTASLGLPLTQADRRAVLSAEMEMHLSEPFNVAPIIGGKVCDGADRKPRFCPHDRRHVLGSAATSTQQDVAAAFAKAAAYAPIFDAAGVEARAQALKQAARLFERERVKLMAVLIREAGKTWQAAHDEVSEAVDFANYYAVQAVNLFADPVRMPGVTGERNVFAWRPRGVVAAISPWNFPLAIFVGQISAALAAGNTVIAKAAPQTPITAFLATQILHKAGIPVDALHLVLGGSDIGAVVAGLPGLGALAFTGSNETAWNIQQARAELRGAFIPLVAETGGFNAMIADSSALPQQVVRDCLRSAFDSAGQRCSAARVLFVHADVAEATIAMLVGAIRELDLGDPMDFTTDIGPVIDQAAQDRLDAHKMRLQSTARELVDLALPETCRTGTYVTPAAYEIDRLPEKPVEIFGPVLQVVRYQRGHLDKVVAAINATGFGLTLGVHSRVASVADYVAQHARVGNLYVNRTQIGARVGSQPSGGSGLSGTGPKAGGPHMLTAFAVERTRSTDITALGGNWQLLNDAED